MARLAALVPPRGQQTVRYLAVLAPASPLRREVVGVRVPRTKAGRCSATDLDSRDQPVIRSFGHDPWRCPRCDARTRQAAIARSSAGDVLAWLDVNATVLLVGPPPRDGPATEAGFG